MPGGLVMVKGVFDKVLETEEPKTFLKLKKKKKSREKGELRGTSLIGRPGAWVKGAIQSIAVYFCLSMPRFPWTSAWVPAEGDCKERASSSWSWWLSIQWEHLHCGFSLPVAWALRGQKLLQRTLGWDLRPTPPAAALLVDIGSLATLWWPCHQWPEEAKGVWGRGVERRNQGNIP